MIRRKGRRESGFTMIELIIVIVILGILAAVAVPKFLSLSADAEKGVARGVTAALRGAVQVLHSQYLLAGTAYTAAAIASGVDAQGFSLGAGAGVITATFPNGTYTWIVAGPTLPTSLAVITESGGF